MRQRDIRQKMLQIRVTEEEREIVEALADSSRHTISTVMRDQLHEAAKKRARTDPHFAKVLAQIRRKYRADIDT